MKIQLKLIDKERKKLTDELKVIEKYGYKEIEFKVNESTRTASPEEHS